METKDKSIGELKAIAYDIVVNLQRLQSDLATINRLIEKKQQIELESKTNKK